MKLGKVLCEHVRYEDSTSKWQRGFKATGSIRTGSKEEASEFYSTTNDIMELFNSCDFTFALIHTPKMKIGYEDVLCTILTLEEAIKSAGKNPKTLEDYLESCIGPTSSGHLVKIVHTSKQHFILTVQDPSYFKQLNDIAQMTFTNIPHRDILLKSGHDIHTCNLDVGFQLTRIDAKFVKISEYAYGLVRQQFKDTLNEMIGNQPNVPLPLISDPQNKLISDLQKKISGLDKKLSKLQQEAKIKPKSGCSTLTTTALAITGLIIGIATNPTILDLLNQQFEQLKLRS